MPMPKGRFVDTWLVEVSLERGFRCTFAHEFTIVFIELAQKVNPMASWKFWQSDSDDHRANARAAYNRKQYTEAETHLRALLSENEEDLWGLDVLGRLLMNTERHSEAVQIWKNYLSSGGVRDRGLIHLSKCERVCGNLESALDSLKHLLLEDDAPVDDKVWEETHKILELAENPEARRIYLGERFRLN